MKFQITELLNLIHFRLTQIEYGKISSSSSFSFLVKLSFSDNASAKAFNHSLLVQFVTSLSHSVSTS